MKELKIFCKKEYENLFTTKREITEVEEFTEIAVAILEKKDDEISKKILKTGLDIPVFTVEDLKKENISNKIEEEASKYERRVLPPFFRTLNEYSQRGNLQFDCPGHQGGEYFKKHPAGKWFVDYFGENIFKADICNADVELGDLLIHEGPAVDAEKHAAEVYNADKTYFVMNGTSTANAVAIKAIVAPDDLVLFDRNNHKSVYNAALVSAGGRAVYLETARNPFGFIGGIDAKCFDEKYLRERIEKIAPEKNKLERPFRLAVIQLGTYDGTIYNARQVVDKIGHLCDYILFDSAWVGYEQFIPMMRDCSPLLLDLKENDPGILVTQSVHKQQAGFSQTSQIHKKDSHIKGQKRYVDHKRFNNSYMLYASTSPFYPLFAALDINARMQAGEAGRKLWRDCIEVGVRARIDVFKRCKLLKPFVPPIVNGKNWYEAPVEEISGNLDYFKFHPNEKWHSFEGYAENQYFVDPNKFMLTTPGIDVKTGEYEEFGIPATILANYLRENRIIPEKNDLNSILFLMTPAETDEKMRKLVDHFVKFEELIERDAPLSEVLPNIYKKNEERYKDYTIRELCQEMHNFYKENNAKLYQKHLFREEYLPEQVMKPYDANVELIKNNAKLVPLTEIVGEIALEGALPYPPGVFCVVPGERWNEVAQKYFLILQDGINKFPGFSPEIQGVYLEEENGKVKAYGYVKEN